MTMYEYYTTYNVHLLSRYLCKYENKKKLRWQQDCKKITVYIVPEIYRNFNRTKQKMNVSWIVSAELIKFPGRIFQSWFHINGFAPHLRDDSHLNISNMHFSLDFSRFLPQRYNFWFFRFARTERFPKYPKKDKAKKLKYIPKTQEWHSQKQTNSSTEINE